MPIGAETFLQPALQPVFDKLFSMGEDLLSNFGGGELAKTLKQWKRQLRMIQAVLVDAEQKQFYNNAIKTWLDDLQDLAFDMEDILEHFAIQFQISEFKEMDQQDLGVFGATNNMITSISENLSTLFNPINPDIQSEVDDITERLEDIQTQIQYLRLFAMDSMQQQTLEAEALRNQRESTSLVCEPKIFGRDDKKQEIIAQLLEDDPSDENYVVIPIVGKGGIGKTTLTQYVYNDEELKGCFDHKAWVCVSDVFDVKRITTSIINAFYREPTIDYSNLNVAQEQLKELLTHKKILIVLDDIWSESYVDWNQLRSPFQHAAKGSRVIMTTRNEKIARMMVNKSNNSIITHLEGLHDDDCWSIFQQHVNDDSEFVTTMRDDIIEKCKGLPLAAKALGGLLKKTYDPRQRQNILKSKIWSEESSVLPVLRLSYQYLPSHLKRMFALCSMYPKDYNFSEVEVVLMWMAQGFLPENQPESLEDIGHKYFFDLVSRSLFEAKPYDEGLFSMHDLIHDLAIWAAGDICYVMDTFDMAQRNFKRTRHVFLPKNVTTLSIGKFVTSQLRSFQSRYQFRIFENLDFIQRFRYIRVLELASDRIELLPECVGDLKHLRTLTLNFIRMKELPKSIGNLWNLQALNLHCLNLKKLPDMRLLGKLRRLASSGRFYFEEMPMGIEKLTNLRRLDEFVVGDGHGERIRDMKNLNHLQRILTISGLENVSRVDDAKEAQLHKKYGLEVVYLEWGNCKNEVDDNTKRDVIEELRPHTSIGYCEMKGYRGLTFPAWLGDACFNNMVKIRLLGCERCECLPPLGQLRSLKNLFIEGMYGVKQIGIEFYGYLRCSKPFPALISLHFSNMRSWESWLHSPANCNKAFPCLKVLQIKKCSSLQVDGPPNLPSLRKMVISGCKELNVSLQSLPLLKVLEVDRCNISFTRKDDLLSSNSDENTVISNGVGCCLDVGEAQQKDGGADERVGDFPNTPFELPHLKELSIKNCPNFISLPEGLLLSSLKRLAFWTCEIMESLPSLLHQFTSLQTLEITNCPNIQRFPEGGLPVNVKCLTIKNTNIKQSVEELGLQFLHSLDDLELSGVGISSDDLSPPPSIDSLSISDVKNLKTISNCLTLSNVTSLHIFYCTEFESLVGNFPLLSHLSLHRCPNFQYCAEGSLPRSLTSLSVYEGVNDIDKPIREWGLQFLSSLKCLALFKLGSCTDSVEHIPSPNLPLPSSLSTLKLTGFRNLKSISCSALKNLTMISLVDCPSFQFCAQGDFGLHLLSSLQLTNLELTNVGSSTNSVEHIPSPVLELPSSLKKLDIKGFPNLKSISCSTVPNLKTLGINDCPKFESFVDNALPPLLQSIHIKDCDLIKPNLQRDPHGCIKMFRDNVKYSLC